MERVTISLDDELASEFDGYTQTHGYGNRSEAVRDLIRQRLGSLALEGGEAPYCVGSLTYTYNHSERELASRLTRQQHDHHDLVLSSVHTHLDHEHCFETVMLRGPTQAVRRFAEAVMAETGVHHGRLHLVAVDAQRGEHRHDDDAEAGDHLHTPPRI